MLSFVTSSILLTSFVAIVTSTYQRRSWGEYYYRIDTIEREQRIAHRVCFIQTLWAAIFRKPPPSCSSAWDYLPEQNDDVNKWCVEKDGSRIPNTLDDMDSYPFDCDKTRSCPAGLIRETTGRCEETCAERDSSTKFYCRNKCICPRGKYRDEKGNCVWKHDCKKTTCEPPMQYTECASKCPFTCATQRHICDYACDRHNHCVCPQGMVLMSKNNGTCIKKEDCPKCEGGSLPTDCAPPCPTTCAKEDNSCDKGLEKCAKGVYCICPPATIQLDRNLPVRCVRAEDCHARCVAPLISKRCMKPCQPTCDDLEPVCEGNCPSSYICACPDGYIQKSNTDQTCIKYEECMSKRLGCEAPAKAVKCDSRCPATCEPNRLMCLRACETEYVCGCPDGYLLEKVGGKTCLKQDDCPKRCQEPKVFASCASLCPPTCQNPNPTTCRRGCSREICVCPPGMVYLDKDTLTCVDLNECPGCQAPAYPVSCTEDCPDNCDPYPRLGIILGLGCTRNCTQKFTCACPDGYILKTKDGKECIRKDECPSSCDYPLVFASCASMCQPTCENPKPAACRRGCSSQLCVCGHGTIQLNEDNVTCVTPDKCPKCSAPKAYRECPRKCQETCDSPDSVSGVCAEGCREDKCICPEGMVFLSATVSVCVKRSQCPKKCTFPEVSASCRSTCEATCDNLSISDSLNCPVECGEEQCVCANGYVRKSSTDSTCVDASSCPTTTVSCEAPKVYAECASKCQPTCALPNPSACTRGCDLSLICVCPDGYVQRDTENRTCIRLKDCPKCIVPKIYVECASKCRPTCATPNPTICDKSCDPGVNCVCPPGMVHPTNEDNSCILTSDCPVSCDFPKMSKTCTSKCLATCDDPVPDCGEVCDPDTQCVCPNGLLQVSGNDSTCVFPSSCPGLPENCPPGKIPTRCASGCPRSCNDTNPGFCTEPCRPRINCECDPRLVQRSVTNDTCIRSSECD